MSADRQQPIFDRYSCIKNKKGWCVNMKKLALFLAVVLLLMSIAGCDRQPEDTTLATDPEKLYITNDEVDLRQKVVDYMYAMANIKWTAGILHAIHCC